ncbi:hypothetical protein ACLKA7_008325 [Drosophila subpalustris]
MCGNHRKSGFSGSYFPLDGKTGRVEYQERRIKGRYASSDYPKYVRNNIMEYVNSPTESDSWQDEAAGV